MVHGKTAVVPDTAVAFNIGTSKLGTNPSAETWKKYIKYELTYNVNLNIIIIYCLVQSWILFDESTAW
jgi:hypothetical protein